MFRKYLVPMILCGLLFGKASCRECLMHLDDNCPARVWQDQYRCIMNQNSLQMIMDCITISRAAGENRICRPKDNTFDPGEDLYESRIVNNVPMLCIIPRSILIHGPPTRLGVWWPASMAGVLLVCPAYDPNFLECLCEHNVGSDQLRIFAQNFLFQVFQTGNTASHHTGTAHIQQLQLPKLSRL